MEPGDKQFRTDAFNAEQSQQANASRERGAAALGQGIGQAGQGIAQGIRWHQEFQASQQAKAFQQSVELERLNMDRMTNQVHMSVMQVQKEEYAAKLQAAQALAQSGIVASQAKMAKLQADMVEFELAQKKKQEEERSQGKFDLSAAVLQAIMRGDTIPSSSPGSYDIPVIDKQTGLAQFRRATPEEVANSEASKRLSIWRERNDIIEGRLKAMSGDFMTPIEEKMRIAEHAADEWMKMSGLQGFASGSGRGQNAGGTTSRPSGGEHSGQSEPSLLPQSGAAPQPETSKAQSRSGQSKDRERYQVVKQLSQPKYQVQMRDGSIKPLTFDTMFPGGVPDNEVIGEALRSNSVLMRAGGGDSAEDRSADRMNVILPVVSDVNRLLSDIKKRGTPLTSEEISQIRIIVNAKLHGYSPTNILRMFGDK